MIHIEVRLYGTLRQYRPVNSPGAPHLPFTLAIEINKSLEDVCQSLGIPEGLVAGAALNDEAVGLSAVVGDGDLVALFPPSAGGS